MGFAMGEGMSRQGSHLVIVVGAGPAGMSVANIMRRTIQKNIGDPLSEELLRGRFKDVRRIKVVLRDNAPNFIEAEALAGV